MMKKKTSFLARAAVMLLLAVLTATTAWASTFSGGDGSSGNPYQIANTADLNQLATDVNNGNTYSGKYFVLTDNITYTGGSETVSNYTAIGDNSHQFAGIFDGNGKTISGIRIYKGGKDETNHTDDYQGLFGKISSTAEVKNVTLANATITGYKYIGGIVGYSDQGTVTDCHVLSDVTFPSVQSYAQYHGGIVGYNDRVTTGNSDHGIVTGCTSAAAFKHVGSVYNTYNIGGIVGYNQLGTVSQCIYLGTTLQGDHYVGAIVGYNNMATVENCYFTSTTIQGKNSTTILDNAESAVGYNRQGAVSNCGLAHKVTLGEGITLGAAATEYGPLTVYGNVAAMAYDDGTSTTIYSTSGSVITLNYTAPAGYTLSGFTVTGGTISGSNLTMPAANVTVTANLAVIDWATEGNDGSADHPYMIYTKDQLDMLAQRVNDGTGDADAATGYSGKYFKLGANIAYNKSTANNFTPIGDNSHSFYGTFDGDGKTISGINISSGANYQGIFGLVAGTVKNLVVSDCSIVGKQYIGAIAGSFQSGTIENCLVGNDVTLSGNLPYVYAGGIVGQSSEGTIKGCTSAATITGTYSGGASCLGGIVGATLTSSPSSTLTDNIFTGAITGNLKEYIGAIVGNNDGGTLTNNYTSTGFGGVGAASSPTGADGDGARKALAISAATGVTITPTGSPSTYSVSGITVYASNTGMSYGGTLYAGATEAVTLTLAYSGTVPAGYILGYSDGNGNAISGNATDGYILTMPAADVTVSASVVPDFATYWHADADHDGSTATKAYIITTTTGLNLLAQRVNAGNDYKNKFFKLGDNITYDGTENNFTRIGNNSLYCSFNGTFDGDGKSISGININSGDADYQGIFGLVDGTVKNLVVSNCRIVGRLRVGVIAGVLRCGTIENCRVGNDVTLSGSAFVGGIVGESQGGTIIGCTSAITITGTMVSGNNAYDLGGVVGSANTYGSYPSSLAGNIFTGTITGKLKDYLGAIVGKNDNGTLTNNYHTSTGFDGIGAADSDKGADGEGARHALTISAADGVTITPTGDATAYSVSSITVYADNTGIKYNNTLYAGATEAVKLTLAYTVPDGYGLSGFTDGNGNVLSKNADGTYTLTMTNVAPTITPTTYLASTLVFEDHGTENNNYNLNLITANDDVTCNVKLNGRTLYKDGKWNTICLPFNVDMTDPDGPLYGATYRTVTEASISGTTLNLTFAEKKSNMDADNTLIAGVPYIIKWNKATDYVDDDAHNIVNPVFAGVKINNVDGTYSNTDESVKFMGTVRALPDVTTWTWGDYDVLLMGDNNTLRYAGSGASLGAFRAYFLVDPTKVDGGQASARLTSFNIDFGNGENNATGIISLTPDPSPNGEGSEYWYTLDGRRLQGQPTKSGIYVNNGKKIIVK